MHIHVCTVFFLAGLQDDEDGGITVSPASLLTSQAMLGRLMIWYLSMLLQGMNIIEMSSRPAYPGYGEN